MTIGNTFRAFTRTIFPGAKFDSEHWVDKKITIITKNSTYVISHGKMHCPGKRLTGARIGNIAWLADEEQALIVRHYLRQGIDQHSFDMILNILKLHGLPPAEGRYMVVLFMNADVVKYNIMGTVTTQAVGCRKG